MTSLGRQQEGWFAQEAAGKAAALPVLVTVAAIVLSPLLYDLAGWLVRLLRGG